MRMVRYDLMRSVLPCEERGGTKVDVRLRRANGAQTPTSASPDRTYDIIFSSESPLIAD